MAEGILLFKLVGEIIMKLSSKVFKELGMMWGIKDDIIKLTNSASIIKAVLVDAQNKQDQNEAISEWLGNLKHAFYDVEDVIDEFSCEALRREVMTKDKSAKQVRIFFSQNNQLLFAYKMARKIKNVRENLDAIAADRNKFGLTINVVEPNIPHVPERDTHSFIPEEEVVGRNDDKEKVKNHLLNMNTKQNISFVVVTGMGGVGKTTLAQLLFNDEDVTQFFDLKIWVCVSELFHLKVVVKKIIETATTTKIDTDEMECLQSKLRELIGGKKFLLVLDDVCLWNENENKWFDLKILLMGGARGSKILITKCDNKLVTEIVDMTLLHNLEGLSEENSWSLFKKVAFKEGEEPINPNLIRLGKEIVQKCKGFPLVLKSIGRSLHSETSEEKWLSIKDKLQPANNLMSNLKLSYDHLPTSYLKQCFVYCSLFPKDYSIRADELIRLSIALGFVPSSDSSKPMEDLGNDYFMELCWRSLLQSSILESEKDFDYHSLLRISSYQNFRFTYKMHDLMHDLAQMVAGDECKSLSNEECDGVNEKTRHISFQIALNHESNLPTSIFKAKGLRTLLLQNDRFHLITIDKSTLNKLFSSCVRLRVLKLNGTYINKVPKSIKKLRQLRYLDLSRNEQLKFLPNSISELQNLQTLDLHGCCSLEELPRDIKNLVNLRHLDLHRTSLKHMPKGMGKLTSLQTLNLFVLDDMHTCKLSELELLNHLKGKLVIKGLKQLNTIPYEATLVRLKDKKYLRDLILNWGWDWTREDDEVDGEMVLEGFEPHPNIECLGIRCYMGERLSNWVSSLSKLISIEIFGCKRLQHLPQFDHLPLLKCLTLRRLHALEFIDIKDSFSSSVFFPSLQYLHLCKMPNLKGWWKFEPSPLPSFPPLLDIVIYHCPKLDSMPIYESEIEISNCE